MAYINKDDLLVVLKDNLKYSINSEKDLLWSIIEDDKEDVSVKIDTLTNIISNVYYSRFINDMIDIIELLPTIDSTLKEEDYLFTPKHCDDCFALGNNGICGYCKFTLNNYDSEEDLYEDGKLPDCPFRRYDDNIKLFSERVLELFHEEEVNKEKRFNENLKKLFRNDEYYMNKYNNWMKK